MLNYYPSLYGVVLSAAMKETRARATQRCGTLLRGLFWRQGSPATHSARNQPFRLTLSATTTQYFTVLYCTVSVHAERGCEPAAAVAAAAEPAAALAAAAEPAAAVAPAAESPRRRPRRPRRRPRRRRAHRRRRRPRRRRRRPRRRRPAALAAAVAAAAKPPPPSPPPPSPPPPSPPPSPAAALAPAAEPAAALAPAAEPAAALFPRRRARRPRPRRQARPSAAPPPRPLHRSISNGTRSDRSPLAAFASCASTHQPPHVPPPPMKPRARSPPPWAICKGRRLRETKRAATPIQRSHRPRRSSHREPRVNTSFRVMKKAARRRRRVRHYADRRRRGRHAVGAPWRRHRHRARATLRWPVRPWMLMARW